MKATEPLNLADLERLHKTWGDHANDGLVTLGLGWRGSEDTTNGTMTVARPTGGTGDVRFAGLLASNGTLRVDNTNGGAAPSDTARGRAKIRQ